MPSTFHVLLHLVATPEELHQLVGRVCHIAVDHTDNKQTIDVMSTCFKGTLDEYLMSKHLTKSKPAESENHNKMDIIARIALQLFETLCEPASIHAK